MQAGPVKPATTGTTGLNTDLPGLYRDMRRVRMFDERKGEVFLRGQSDGSMHVDDMGLGHPGANAIVGGGASVSDPWMRIPADTAGLPIRIPASPDAPSTGSAILAAHGAGFLDSIDDGTAAMAHPGRRVDPIAGNVERYGAFHRRCLAPCPAAKAVLEGGAAVRPARANRPLRRGLTPRGRPVP